MTRQGDSISTVTDSIPQRLVHSGRPGCSSGRGVERLGCARSLGRVRATASVRANRRPPDNRVCSDLQISQRCADPAAPYPQARSGRQRTPRTSLLSLVKITRRLQSPTASISKLARPESRPTWPVTLRNAKAVEIALLASAVQWHVWPLDVVTLATKLYWGLERSRRGESDAPRRQFCTSGRGASPWVCPHQSARGGPARGRRGGQRPGV